MCIRKTIVSEAYVAYFNMSFLENTKHLDKLILVIFLILNSSAIYILK